MHRVIDINNEVFDALAKRGEDLQRVALEHNDICPFFPTRKSFVITGLHMYEAEI